MSIEDAVARTKAGPVDWEQLKEDLLELPKGTLADMVSMWINNYWANQNYWITYVERDFGQQDAERLDGEIFRRTAKIQAQSLKKLLGLGDDMHTLAFVLKHITTQWPPAGFDWAIDEVTDERVIFHVNSCPMGTYRKGQGLEVFRCKEISEPLYDAMVKAVNPRMKAVCTHAHPDEAVEGLMCSWEVTYE
ncbi:MAG: L-2-amino-thiazoline-4-carboxylic acid hydrolase [Clostridiales Family XIII bacterium]|nr:L-2-amino-thiazoline-4-carboxylic acid hydrolase [Clostridiales Family XIII bacterium]